MINSLILYVPILFAAVMCSVKDEKNQVPYFEGKIVLENEFIIKVDKAEIRDLKKLYGSRTEFFLKEGNILERYDGGEVLESWYLMRENKLYEKKHNPDTLYWSDCGLPGQKILKIEINPKKEKILGIECDELITYYGHKKTFYYFNSDTLGINPDWYKKFTITNKNISSLRMKAACLKYKIEYADFIITGTATSISHQNLNDDLFAIPEHKILIRQ